MIRRIVLTTLLVAGMSLAIPSAHAGSTNQPDLQVGPIGGDLTDIDNYGVVQTSTLTKKRGRTASFEIVVNQDGTHATDTFVLTGCGSNDGYIVTYLDGNSVDQTAAFTGAGYTYATGKPDPRTFILEIKVPRHSLFKTFNCPLNAHSNDGNTNDGAAAFVKARHR